MNEFKMVVEGFQESLNRVVEVMNYRFDKVDGRLDKVEGRLDKVEGRLDKVEGHLNKVDGRLERLETDNMTIKQQLALLHEGQTEIKSELKKKADTEDLAKLEIRVARLESKVA